MKIQRVDENFFDVSEVLQVLPKPRRYQGGYTSPTFVKSWLDCPTRQVINEIILLDKPKSLMTIIGTITHLMYEHMQSEWSPASIEDIKEAWETYAKPHHKLDLIALSDEKQLEVLNAVLDYVKSYNELPDYLEESDLLLKDVWRTNKVQNEHFVKVEHFEKFGIPLPTLMNLLDRLDFRGEDIWVIDYKTGDKNSGDYTLQVIVYSWAIQKIFGKKPHCLIISPGAPRKFTKVTWSMRQESDAIEKIYDSDKEVIESFASGEFPVRKNQYCEYCPIYEACWAGQETVEFKEDPKKLKKS